MLNIIKFLFRLLRSTVFLLILVIGLGISLIQASISILSLTGQVASMSASAATATAQHKKQMAKAISREKAKARLKRLIVAVPVLGTGAAVAFEANEMQNWLDENPNQSASDYGCEVAASSAEVLDEVLAVLPEKFRPSDDFVMSQMPECNQISDKS